ncbi:hypothetical protein [Listeria marthii]|uniref:hypothetical protein n=1 Tax=Listeria marthii TaxID=529731 RepID=UPI00162486AB|nr:hypothetical protein [Listeria marthii]MBC2011728.1 hypothetical protein [Listeria marthii]
MSEIVINPDELELVTTTLQQLMESIVNTALPSFNAVKNSAFYIEGEAKEEVERILSKSMIEVNGSDMVQMGADFAGKVQMLATYYNLINEYCIDAMITFKDTDEKMAKLWEKTCEEALG